MWYRQAKEKIRKLNYEGKILQADAEHCVRAHLFLLWQGVPSERVVAKYVNRAMNEIEARYGNWNNVRHEMSGESLKPAVEAVVREIMTSTKRGRSGADAIR